MGSAGLVWVSECTQIIADGGELAIHIATVYRATHHQMVPAPSVVSAVAIGVKGPREVGAREGCHGAAHVHATDIGQGRIKCGHRSGQFAEIVGLSRVLEVVAIMAADGHEEDLAA